MQPAADERLRARKARAFDQSAVGMALLDRDGRWLDVNEAFARMLETDRKDLLSRSFEAFTVEDDLEISHRHMSRLLSGLAHSCQFEKRYRRADGEVIWVQVHGWVLEEQGDDPGFLVTQARDITVERRTRDALLESEARLGLALEGADLGMWHWNVFSDVFEFSDSAAGLLGYENRSVQQSLDALRELFHPDDREGISQAMRAHLGGSAPTFDRVFRLRHRDGDYIWVLARGRIVHRDIDRRPLRVSGTLMDVSKWKNLESRLRTLATTDELTGLLNRRAGINALDKAIKRSDRLSEPLSMVLLDVDHFKRINDRKGHEVGDQVLQALGGLLNGNRRESDLAIRWGGEEFAIILPETEHTGARAQAQRLFDGIAGLADRFPELDSLSASFGLVTRRPDESARSLMKRADALMYQAKNTGRASIRQD